MRGEGRGQERRAQQNAAAPGVVRDRSGGARRGAARAHGGRHGGPGRDRARSCRIVRDRAHMKVIMAPQTHEVPAMKAPKAIWPRAAQWRDQNCAGTEGKRDQRRPAAALLGA